MDFEVNKRIALRRSSPCGTVGRLVRGFNRVQLHRVGDLTDPGAGRPNLKQAKLYRVGESPSCANACYANTPGQTLFDQSYPAVHRIVSGGFGPQEDDVYEISGIGCFGAGSNFRIAITADLQWLGIVPPPAAPGSGGHAYLNDSGLNLPGRPFIFGMAAQLAADPPIMTDALYHTYVMTIYPGAATPYADFSGPLGPQSVYFWPPVLFPDFQEGDWNVKNVHIVVTTT